MASQFANYFFHGLGQPVALTHRVRRDYPLPGDSALAIYEHDAPQSAVFVVRPEGADVKLLAVVQVADNKFATWATFQLLGYRPVRCRLRFRLLLESARRTADWFLNRPGIQKLRTIDESFYTAACP